MSDAILGDAERLASGVHLPKLLLGAGNPRGAADRLKKLTHHHDVLMDPRPEVRTQVVLDLAAAAEALPDDADLAEWRRFVSRNVHRLERGRVEALVQLALDEGSASAPGRAVTRWLARHAYQGVWFRKVGALPGAVDGCTLVLEGHTDAVFDVVWLPGGREALTGAADGAIKVWSTETGFPRWSVTTSARKPLHERGPVRRVAVDPQGSRAIAGDSTGEISVWSLSSSAHLLWWAKAHNTSVNGLLVTPDGRRLVSVGAALPGGDDSIVLWNLEKGERIASRASSAGTIWGLALLPDGHSIFTVESGGRVTRWELDGLVRGDSVDGPPGGTWIGCLPYGRALVVAGLEALWVLDPLTMQVEATHEIPRGLSRGMAVHPDGERVLVSRGYDIDMLDLRRGEWTLSLRGHGGRATALAVHPDGASVLWASEEGTVRRWSLESAPPVSPRPHRSEVTGVFFDAGRGRVLSVGNDGAIIVWDPATATERARLGTWAGAIVTAAFDPRRGHLVVVHEDGSPAVWDLATDTCVSRFETRTYGLDQVAISAGAEMVATAGGYSVDDGPGLQVSTSYQIRLWDGRDGTLIGVLDGHADEITALVFHPAVGLVSAGREGMIRTWDIDTGRCLRAIKAGVCFGLTPCPGERAMLAGDSTLQRWDLGEGTLVWELPATGDRIRSISLSSDARSAITLGSAERAVVVWDLDERVRVARWEADVATRAGALLAGGRIALGDDSGAVTFLEPFRFNANAG